MIADVLCMFMFRVDVNLTWTCLAMWIKRTSMISYRAFTSVFLFHACSGILQSRKSFALLQNCRDPYRKERTITEYFASYQQIFHSNGNRDTFNMSSNIKIIIQLFSLRYYIIIKISVAEINNLLNI